MLRLLQPNDIVKFFVFRLYSLRIRRKSREILRNFNFKKSKQVELLLFSH